MSPEEKISSSSTLAEVPQPSSPTPVNLKSEDINQSTPPTPHTNRRTLHDVATIANIPSERLKSFQLALVGAETMKRRDLVVGGWGSGPDGIELLESGKKLLKLDEIKPNIVKKAVKEWVDQNLTREQGDLVEQAGILKATRGRRKQAAKESGDEESGNRRGKERGPAKADTSKTTGGTRSPAAESSTGNEVPQESENNVNSSNIKTEEIRANLESGPAPPVKERKNKRKRSEPQDQDAATKQLLQQQQEQQEKQQVQPEIDWDEEIEYTWNCDQIRRKIRTFIEDGGMKVTAFQRTICANSNSYGRFMKLRGPYSGYDNSTFEGATRFFKAREAANLPMPKKPKLTNTAANVTTASKAKDVNPNHPDISDIQLPGEETDSVEIYDTCDEIRRKISAHLRKPGVTKAQFLRDIAAEFRTQPVHIHGKQLDDFRAKSGPLSGNTSRVYYGSYVYFEKCRTKEGKSKSKHRVEMEGRWGNHGGVDIVRPSGGRVWAHKDDIPTRDQYGTLHIERGARRRHK